MAIWEPLVINHAPSTAHSQLRDSTRSSRQREVDFLFADRSVFDCRAEFLFQKFDALLDDGFRGTGAGGNQHGFIAGEPGAIDIVRAVDQMRRSAGLGG